MLEKCRDLAVAGTVNEAAVPMTWRSMMFCRCRPLPDRVRRAIVNLVTRKRISPILIKSPYDRGRVCSRNMGFLSRHIIAHRAPRAWMHSIGFVTLWTVTASISAGASRKSDYRELMHQSNTTRDSKSTYDGLSQIAQGQ